LERKGHAEDLCQEMDIAGYDVIIIIGGDGTMHECVNGILHRTHFHEEAHAIHLALIPAGTGK
jgi:diacylglycerol kinase family enzyme